MHKRLNIKFGKVKDTFFPPDDRFYFYFLSRYVMYRENFLSNLNCIFRSSFSLSVICQKIFFWKKNEISNPIPTQH